MMKFKALPIEIQTRMLDCQEEQGNERSEDPFIHSISESLVGGGFNWGASIKGDVFWNSILDEDNIENFFKRYPKKEQYQIY